MSDIDPAIGKVLKECGLGDDAVWEHKQSGNWIAKHWALEKAAAHKNIVFDAPQIIFADPEKKLATICATGHLGDRTEWSIGEAAPYNTQQQYPFAMAEKRAKDRVILKLIGLHGLAYSEEEADDFTDNRPATVASAVGDAFKEERAKSAHDSDVALMNWKAFDYTKTLAQTEARALSALIHDDKLTPDEATLDAHIVDHQSLIEAIMQCSTWWDNIEDRIKERRDVLRQRDAENLHPQETE